MQPFVLVPLSLIGGGERVQTFYQSLMDVDRGPKKKTNKNNLKFSHRLLNILPLSYTPVLFFGREKVFSLASAPYQKIKFSLCSSPSS